MRLLRRGGQTKRINLKMDNYENFSHEQLVAKIRILEAKLKSSRPVPNPLSLRVKSFDFNSYPRRKIALKFCYSGWEYNGLAFQNGYTPLPTVEGTLYEALAATKLIDPSAGPEGCGWERCGRTDKGVSGAGQVVSLWLRSNIPDTSPSTNHSGPSAPDLIEDHVPDEVNNEDQLDGQLSDDSQDPFLFTNLGDDPTPTPRQDVASQNIKEIPYVSLLNRVLPPTIRIIAWSPVASSFSARFNCKYRHYKYFFTSTNLNISAMRDAAERLIGENDFRNLCKVDASKQITSFKRIILRADIEPCSLDASSENVPEPANPDLYVFNLIGSAFLYHQVRHIMAVLFLVGTGLESPSVVSSLLNTLPEDPRSPFREGEETPAVVECKPVYQMADGLPLMLWDCAFSEEDVKWQVDSAEHTSDPTRPGETQASSGSSGSLHHELHSALSRSIITSALNAHFLQAAAKFHPLEASPIPLPADSPGLLKQLISSKQMMNIPIGGGVYRRSVGKSYIPLLQRKRLDPVEVINERWRLGKGSRREVKKNSEVDFEADE